MQDPQLAITKHTVSNPLNLIIPQKHLLKHRKLPSPLNNPNPIKLQINNPQLHQPLKPAHKADHIITQNEHPQPSEILKMGDLVDFYTACRGEV